MAQQVKNPPANAGNIGDAGLIPGSGRSSGGGKWQSTPVFLPKKFHGQEESGGYSPKGRKESDPTERLSTAQSRILSFQHVAN